MFLAECSRLETSSMPYYDFNEMKAWELSISSSWHLSFLILSYSPF